MLKVKDFMSKYPKSLKPYLSLLEAADLLLQNRIDGAPVVNENGKIIGIVTKTHLLKAMVTSIDPNAAIERFMHNDVIMINENASPEDAWRKGLENNLGRLPVIDESGNLVGMWTKTNLIKAFEKKYIDTSNQLNVIINSTYNGIFAISKFEKVIFINKSAERILKIDENVIGSRITTIIPYINVERVLKNREHIFGEKLLVRGNEIIINMSPVISNGIIVGAVAVFQQADDIEKISIELNSVKQLNTEYNMMIESSYDGIIVNDGSGTLLRINKSYERIAGINPHELIGKTLRELLEEKFIDKCVTFTELKRGYPVSFIQRLKTGRTILVTSNPIFDENTCRIIRVVSNCRDVTDLNLLTSLIEQEDVEKQRVMYEITKLRAERLADNKIIAQSSVMRKLLELVIEVADVDSTALILGESGVGKEVIAKFIHKTSQRCKGPFMTVNCGAIPENLLESEIFGYNEGAFTGARKGGKPGVAELAHGGTLFFDEIGELPLKMQVKLLHLLQDKEVKRVGGTESFKIDIRILAATNRDLDQLVQEEKFRLDLFYRLNVITINIPPLRDRKEDIQPLSLRFLDKFNQLYKRNKYLHPNCIDQLVAYKWPGNVRELENLIERLVVLSKGDLICIEALPEKIKSDFPNVQTNNQEKENLEKLYKYYKSTRKVANIMGVNQSTVVRKMKKYGISPHK